MYISIHNFYCIVVLFLVSLKLDLTSALKCYTCHTNDNSLCTEDELKECPTDRAYDRCITTIIKNPKDGLTIKKDCALAPCHLRDQNQRDFLNLKEQCESGDNEKDCVYCCKQDGCNKDYAFQITSNNYLTFTTILLCICSFIGNVSHFTIFLKHLFD